RGRPAAEVSVSRRTATLALAGALLAVGAPAGPAAASGEAPKADPAVEALLARLERPPEARSVMGIVRMPAVARDPATALRVVCVLWHAGGYASAAGLRVLARHDDACVRATAIRGVAHVGLRVRAGFDAVREALKD